MPLIKADSGLQHGVYTNKFFESRTIRQNKNVIGVCTGSTGSGKTYTEMSMAESWYTYRFKQEFPSENICFSTSLLMKRILGLQKAGKLRRGELFILEEAGANFGNLDFQNKLSKMFSYILQSFRSMNLILLMNVPVLTMINKSARQLIHLQMTTMGIDFEKELTKVKLKHHQLSQDSGKSYWKYPRVRFHGKYIKLQRLSFIKPSDDLCIAYEQEKQKFVVSLTEDFLEKAAEMEDKDDRKPRTDIQKRRYDLAWAGNIQEEIAKIEGVDVSAISGSLCSCDKKGYPLPPWVTKGKMNEKELKMWENAKEMSQKPNRKAFLLPLDLNSNITKNGNR